MDIAATQLPRVLVCNGSLLMEASPASINAPMEDAQEGIAAHYIASSVLSGRFSDPIEFVERQTPNGIWVTPDMGENVAEFTDYIMTKHPILGGWKTFVETDCDFAVPNTDIIVRCRSDYVAFNGTTLYIHDFKYGWRIVDPFENWTLIAYAIGVCQREGWKPANVVFMIHQPRPYHPDGKHREWPITGEELVAYAVTLAGKLGALTNALQTSPHCHKCKALANCYAASQAGYNSIDAASVPFRDTVDAIALSFEIGNLRRASDAINLKLEAYEELAKHRLKSGELIPGWAVERTLGNRAYVKGITPETISLLTGKKLDQLTTPPKPITPAALERLQVSEEIVAAITYRPPTGEKLVKFDATKKAKKLFS